MALNGFLHGHVCCPVTPLRRQLISPIFGLPGHLHQNWPKPQVVLARDVPRTAEAVLTTSGCSPLSLEDSGPGALVFLAGGFCGCGGFLAGETRRGQLDQTGVHSVDVFRPSLPAVFPSEVKKTRAPKPNLESVGSEHRGSYDR